MMRVAALAASATVVIGHGEHAPISSIILLVRHRSAYGPVRGCLCPAAAGCISSHAVAGAAPQA